MCRRRLRGTSRLEGVQGGSVRNIAPQDAIFPFNVSIPCAVFDDRFCDSASQHGSRQTQTEQVLNKALTVSFARADQVKTSRMWRDSCSNWLCQASTPKREPRIRNTSSNFEMQSAARSRLSWRC